MKRELWVTTDFFDNLYRAGRRYTEADIDHLMRESARLGATCHEWVLDTIWGIYDGMYNGYDLLEVARVAAHRYGQRFIVVFKPFEGCLAAAPCVLPHGFPCPDEVPVVETKGGFSTEVRPFVAANPDLRQARRPEDDDPGGRIGSIRLVKADDGSVSFDLDSLHLAYSWVNGNFRSYRGPMRISERLEYRMGYPYSDRQRRIIEISGLDLPDNANFLKICCDQSGDRGSFGGEAGEIVELVSTAGDIIPSTVACGRMRVDALYKRARTSAAAGISRYWAHPETSRLLDDPDSFSAACGEGYRFDWDGVGQVVFDSDGVLAVARGKAQHIHGSLHPAYAEVREHWMEHLRFCLDRGVDGVNIRFSSHNRPPDPWAYGYTAADIREGGINLAGLARRNGEAIDGFICEAAQLLHENGKQLGVHVEGGFFYPEHLSGIGPIPMNFDWHWEKWIIEWADFIELRGVNKLRPFAVREVVDRIGDVARRAGKPFVYQSVRGMPVHFDPPFPALETELSWLCDHPLVTAYNLYETDSFSRLNTGGEIELSPELGQLIRCKLGIGRTTGGTCR